MQADKINMGPCSFDGGHEIVKPISLGEFRVCRRRTTDAFSCGDDFGPEARRCGSGEGVTTETGAAIRLVPAEDFFGGAGA